MSIFQKLIKQLHIIAIAGRNNTLPECFFQFAAGISGNGTTLRSHCLTLIESLWILDLCKFSGRNFCQHIQRQLRVGHIVPQIFLMQPFQFFVLPCIHSGPGPGQYIG